MTFPRIFLFVAGLPLCALQLPAADRAMEENYGERLRKVFRFQEKISDLNPVFQTLYPIAIVEGKSFFIFQPNPEKKEYRLVHTAPDPMNNPKGIRAAMPLGFWENRTACVVTGEVFDDSAGYATIFHEFVHCAQAECCEPIIKEKLSVTAKSAIWRGTDGRFAKLSRPGFLRLRRRC